MITHEIIKVKPTITYGKWTPPEPVLIPDLKVGDLVYYNYTGTQDKVLPHMCSVVVEINLNPVTMVKDSAGGRKPYLLMALTGTAPHCRSPNFTGIMVPWTRFGDATHMHLVPKDILQGFMDDFVSNYIQTHFPQARKYLPGIS